MGKHTLEIEYDYDFVLIGISSHEKDYRICWALNNKLSLNLVKTEPLEIKDKKQEEHSHFSLFCFEQPDEFMEYFIIANRSEKGLLIPEQKQVDYFFIIRGEVENETAMEIVKQIKEINLVQTAFRIDVASLKSKQNLIL
ncbi:MAG TPA: IPExxxVDY family protein [Bacteroidia bacterium]